MQHLERGRETLVICLMEDMVDDHGLQTHTLPYRNEVNGKTTTLELTVA